MQVAARMEVKALKRLPAENDEKREKLYMLRRKVEKDQVSKAV